MAQAKCAQFESELKTMFTNGGTAECEVVGKRAIAYYNCQHVDIKTGCDAAIMEAINMFFNGGKLIKTALVQDGLKKYWWHQRGPMHLHTL